MRKAFDAFSVVENHLCEDFGTVNDVKLYSCAFAPMLMIHADVGLGFLIQLRPVWPGPTALADLETFLRGEQMDTIEKIVTKIKENARHSLANGGCPTWPVCEALGLASREEWERAKQARDGRLNVERVARNERFDKERAADAEKKRERAASAVANIKAQIVAEIAVHGSDLLLVARDLGIEVHPRTASVLKNNRVTALRKGECRVAKGTSSEGSFRLLSQVFSTLCG